MDAWAPYLVPAMIAIGGAFAWLIREIVKASKDAVKELKTTLAKAEKDRDTWRDRAYASGWRSKE